MTDRQTDRQRQRQTETDREGERNRDRQTDRHRQRSSSNSSLAFFVSFFAQSVRLYHTERGGERDTAKQQDTANIFGVKTSGRRVDQTERKLATADRLTVNVKTSQSLFTDSTNSSTEYFNARTFVNTCRCYSVIASRTH